MPPGRTRSSKRKAVVGLGPAIPLAIALIHNAVLPSAGTTNGSAPVLPTEIAPVVCEEGLEDFNACHSEYPSGCSASGRYDAYLNVFKNQLEWKDSRVQGWLSTLDDITQVEGRIPAGLGNSNHGDYIDELGAIGEGRIYGVVGYVYAIKAEGKESSNCQLEPGEEDENVDFHIYIGFDPAVANRIRNNSKTAADKTRINPKAMIVEMTPHYRARFHPEWSLSAVQSALGKQVRVSGQLIADNEHYLASQDCGRKDHTSACWRATVWELHPVTQFETCGKETCDASSGGWSPIGDGP